MGDLKRRDHKGRILYNGEYQEKDGSYTYRYTECGKRKKLTSWRLTGADSIPSGKKSKPPLREQIKELEKRLGLYDSDITVSGQVEKYISTRTDVTHNTKAGYHTVQRVLEKDAFGERKVKDVKYSEALKFLQRLQSEGRGCSSIHSIRGVLRPAFQMAAMDELIAKNPFDFELKDALVNDRIKREALSYDDERRFLKFVKEDKHFSRYYDGIYILFKTGLRISEFCGLTRSDIDFEKHEFRVDHQLQRMRDGRYIIVSPKTDAGNRTLPMKSDVEQRFKKLIKDREYKTIEPTVTDENGKVYIGFLYLDKNGMPLVALHWEKYFEHICEKFNKLYKKEIPKVTPHVARHTYCSRMAVSGISAKSLQYLMGHSDISTTMNVYTTFRLEDVKEELSRLG